MIREDRGKLLLTVSQPDLALYRGPSDEAFDKDGKRITLDDERRLMIHAGFAKLAGREV